MTRGASCARSSEPIHDRAGRTHERLVAGLLGPAGPELTCEECFDLLDVYVDSELAGRMRTSGSRACASTYRLPGVRRGARQPARPADGPSVSTRPLQAVAGDARTVDLAAAERAARDLLVALGADLDSDGLRETPRRMAAAYAELLTPEPFNLTTFPNDEGYDELVVVRDIPFQSLCMHHLLPFHGVAHVAYLPAERIVGLSKLARVVEQFARDLQLQERLTTQVAGCLQERAAAEGRRRRARGRASVHVAARRAEARAPRP